MIILGIDTSCDDTCVALIKVNDKRPGFSILSNIISSQVKLHAKYGGVYPSLARREHQKNLPVVFKKATGKTNFSDIDLIGVTVGPGLEPCLYTGVNFTRDLALKLKRPLIPINHLEAHILINWLESSNILMPAVCLTVSGGHTVLFLMKKIGEYKLLGETRDDAAGECFDKVARILGLGYPGGPIISKEAEKYEIKNNKYKVRLPRPMIYTKDYDFSFSGLKTAVLYQYQKSKIKNKKYKQAMCEEVQQAIIDVLIHKTLKAAKDYGVQTIILGGGVAANKELREQLKRKIEKELPNVRYLMPAVRYCTDNGVMIASAAFLNKKEKIDLQQIKANANLKI